MSIAAISPHTARILLRIRWLAWGAIAALLVVHAFAAANAPPEAATLPTAKVAADPGEACGCQSVGRMI